MAGGAVHPGEQLAEELNALKMSAAELARQLKVPTNRVTSILNGQRADDVGETGDAPQIPTLQKTHDERAAIAVARARRIDFLHFDRGHGYCLAICENL